MGPPQPVWAWPEEPGPSVLSVEGVVQLVLHDASVGADRRCGVAVEVPVEQHRQGGRLVAQRF